MTHELTFAPMLIARRWGLLALTLAMLVMLEVRCPLADYLDKNHGDLSAPALVDRASEADITKGANDGQ